jgi:hypothetical protein
MKIAMRGEQMVKRSWLGLGVVVVGVGLLISHGARAGLKQTTTVGIDTVNRNFYGSFGSARNSADAVQYIGCAVDNNFGSCSARNSAGTSVICTSSDPQTMALMMATSGDSYIYVTYNAAGTCTRVFVSSSSYYAPRLP